MSRKHWNVVAVVIGAGILLQIPGHGGRGEEHGGHTAVEVPARASDQSRGAGPDPAAGPYRTIVLEVTGMT